jgi:membrane protein implicated in regulation of membrane protease activity
MNNPLQFIVKVFLLSALISIAIKYGGPWLRIPASPAIALIAVFLPSVLVAMVLMWRWQRMRSPKIE